jgi:proteasome lid subunit RPN8/RPN11
MTITAAAVLNRVMTVKNEFAAAVSMKMKGALNAMKKNPQNLKNPTFEPRRPAALRFSPTAWAKLLFLRDEGDTEIGAFGISAQDDLLFVEDVQLATQTCTWVHVQFDDESVADFFDRQVDAGRRPEEFGRLWIHTHPGISPEPSGTDEATFSRVFGRSDWAVMFILARGGQTFARLRYNVGPGAEIKLPVEIDYSRPFTGSSMDAWEEEYRANVRIPLPDPPKKPLVEKVSAPEDYQDPFLDDWRREAWEDYLEFERAHEEIEYGNIRGF